MKRKQRTVRFLTSVRGSKFLVWGLSAAMTSLAFPVMAENPLWGGVKITDTQVVTQDKTVFGTILDENGEPMIGVSVLVKGTTIGTVTDFDGKFSLNASSGSTLVISYIGYQTREIKVGNQKSLSVVLKPDNQLLDEVVVVGYGTVKKRDLTGAVASVKSEDILRMPTSNVIEAIQGQVAGLDITRTSGEVGSEINMTLRGTRSINGSNKPLFIIDGMEGSYDELNPNDIASIEVLKDASSTAVYGAAGANGVIIITTKTPKMDKFSVDLDAYYGWNVISEFPKLNTGKAYIDFRREAMRTAGLWESAADDRELFPEYMRGYVENNQWVDWFDLGTQTGTTTNYNLSTSYSNDRMTSYFSLGYYDIEGLLKGDELERYSARAKFDFKVNEIVKYGLNLYAQYSKNDKRSSRYWNRILCTPPLGDVYDEEGNLVLDPTGGGTINPLADNVPGECSNNIKTLSVTPQVYLELTPLEGLSFRSVLGGYFRNVKQGVYVGPNSYEGIEKGDVYAKIPNKFTYDYKWQNILTYHFNIHDDHDFTVTGVTEWSKFRKEEVEAIANGFDTNKYQYHNLGAATGVPSVSSKYVASQKMSYVARLNYSYKGRYLLTLSNRWDGSSVLADGNKWDMFPAGAVAWRISDEAFMEDVEAVSNLKLRASYGVTGNAGAPEYGTLDSSRTGIFGFQDVPVSYSGYGEYVANKALGWEKSYMTDFGIDLGLWKDRISLALDWYRTDTKDVLYAKDLPYSAGGYGGSAFKIMSNVGETRNTGLELTITSHNFTGPKFTWDTTLSFSTNKEEVIKTTSEGPLKYEEYYLIAGEPIKTYYGYKYDGIWGTSEEAEAAKYGKKPGDIRVAENGEPNYTLNNDDFYVLGNASPKWSGSLSNSFTYKNFDLNVLLIARWDWTIPYGLTGWYRQDGISPSPAVCDYWTPENQSARYPRPNVNGSTDEFLSTANYFDGSYLKVKTVSLGYTLPKEWLKKVNIDKARVYFTASNPFIWTKCDYLKDYDPEKGGNDDDAPLSKQYVIGINISF